MAVLSALTKRDTVINLKKYNTFAETLEELSKKLEDIENRRGMQIIIDLGDKRVTTKQVHVIEDILLDYGIHLKELRANGPPEKPSEDNVFSEMSPYEQTELICKNLRSGQRIFAEGNLVVLGDINPGAEVIAGGNIIVMGNLRGVAHAGAFGDEKAIIAAYRLNPTQIRIANHITRPPDGEVIIVNTPELAKIRAGKVIIEKLKI